MVIGQPFKTCNSNSILRLRIKRCNKVMLKNSIYLLEVLFLAILYPLLFLRFLCIHPSFVSVCVKNNYLIFNTTMNNYIPFNFKK